MNPETLSGIEHVIKLRQWRSDHSSAGAPHKCTRARVTFAAIIFRTEI